MRFRRHATSLHRCRRPTLLAAALAFAPILAGAWSGPAAAQSADSAAVLIYHRFGEPAYPSTNIGVDSFEAHLAELADPKYHVLPLSEIVEALEEGESLSDRSVAITIDDAYRSVYELAWPRLKAAGIPFTLFVSTDLIDRGATDLMTWEQLAELAASPLVEIGNHAASHAHLPARGLTNAREDILRAQGRIEEELGVTPKIFAYPFGEISLPLKDLVRSLGFTAAFGQHSGALGATLDPFELPRFALNEDMGDLKRLRTAVEAWPLPVSDLVPADPLIPPEGNPPLAGFTLLPEAGAPDALACYSNVDGLVVERLDRRIELRFKDPLPPGRTRVNCTLPAEPGRWRWLGRQFLVLE